MFRLPAAEVKRSVTTLLMTLLVLLYFGNYL